MQKLSFLFLGANSPWAYGLAEALAEQHHTHAVQFYDWQTYYRLKPSWSQRIPPKFLERTIHILPPGYAGGLELLFRFYLQLLIADWYRKLQRISGVSPWVIAPHPDFCDWVKPISAERLIYYNYDDYSLYRPHRKAKILKQEKELIERSFITLCASKAQAVSLQKLHPQSANRIHHYPHGLVKSYLNPQPENSPEPMTVGYVGNLGDRLDWKLIYQIAKASSNITFVFVGGLDEQIMIEQGDWQTTRQQVLALPNVRHVAKVPSDQVAKYYWSFAVNWIPYVVDHPFNQASCPTKIMDGIASGRPMISTSIPECLLYSNWIKIFYSANEAISLICQELKLSIESKTYEHSLNQLEFARQNTWQVRAQTLEKLILNL